MIENRFFLLHKNSIIRLDELYEKFTICLSMFLAIKNES